MESERNYQNNLTLKAKFHKVVSTPGIQKELFIATLFFNLLNSFVLDTINYYQHNYDIKSLENISQFDIYFYPAGNLFTLVCFVCLVNMGKFSFFNGMRMIGVAILEYYLTILQYATSYYQYGLTENGNPNLIHDYQSSLYFSLVTWSTLGYGDFLPPKELRIFAASEALTGLFSQALVFAIIAYVFSVWVLDIKQNYLFDDHSLESSEEADEEGASDSDTKTSSKRWRRTDKIFATAIRKNRRAQSLRAQRARRRPVSRERPQ